MTSGDMYFHLQSELESVEIHRLSGNRWYKLGGSSLNFFKHIDTFTKVRIPDWDAVLQVWQDKCMKEYNRFVFEIAPILISFIGNFVTM